MTMIPTYVTSVPNGTEKVRNSPDGTAPLGQRTPNRDNLARFQLETRSLIELNESRDCTWP